MKRLRSLLALAALVFTLSNSAQAQQAITPDQLVGVWKFHSQVIHNASTTGKDMAGPFASGFLMYVREGKNLRLSVNLAGAERKQAVRYATDEEAIQLFRSYTGYTGIVELSSTATSEGTPGTTTIDVDLDQHGIGPHPRTYMLDGTKLTTVTKDFTITTTTSFEKVQ